MRNHTNLKNNWERLTAAHSFVLACHQRPDGDTLGSALALAHVLRQLGKDVVVLSEDGIPDNYTFIPESDTVLQSTDRRDFEIGIIIDADGAQRAGKAAEPITSARITACIDHHVPDKEFGDIRIIDHSAAATAELIGELFTAVGVDIDNICATQLMTGIIADTGAFRFPNVTSRTFSIAAKLRECGADSASINREVYECRPAHYIKLLGRALNSLEMDETGAIVWVTVTSDDLEELGASDADTDGIVNYAGMVKGAKVYILFRQIEPESIRVSLRSRGAADMNQVARAFGGGGHVNAAGCTLNVPLEEAKKQVVDEVRKWMAS